MGFVSLRMSSICSLCRFFWILVWYNVTLTMGFSLVNGFHLQILLLLCLFMDLSSYKVHLYTFHYTLMMAWLLPIPSLFIPGSWRLFWSVSKLLTWVLAQKFWASWSSIIVFTARSGFCHIFMYQIYWMNGIWHHVKLHLHHFLLFSPPSLLLASWSVRRRSCSSLSEAGQLFTVPCYCHSPWYSLLCNVVRAI